MTELIPSAKPEQYFRTVDGKELKSINDMIGYIATCSIENFNHHVTENRNDFANWIRGVFGLNDIANKMIESGGRENLLFVITNFINAYDAAYALAQSNPEGNTSDKLSDAQANIIRKESSDTQSLDASSENSSAISSELKSLESKSLESKSSEINAFEIKSADNTSSEVQTDVHKDGNISTLATGASDTSLSGFRQFTDEELEKFTKFVKKEETFTSDEKVEYLKAALQELINIIRDMRRAEKDPFIADLMLRALTPKIDYFALTKKTEDYDKIVNIMKDIQKEIEYTAGQTSVNFADEIIKALEIEKISTKKSLNMIQ